MKFTDSHIYYEILILFAAIVAQAQVATFDVIMAGHSIGSVKVLPQDHSGGQRNRIEA